MIEFSGYTWKVSNSPHNRKPPGNNFWSKSGVWVDENGYLHLQLKQDPKTKHWICSELKSLTNFGLGTYEFLIEGNLSQLDKNIVFGLFKYSGVDYYDELDIEFAKWGNEQPNNMHYTVYPAENSKADILQASFEFSSETNLSIHRFTRETDKIIFESHPDLSKQPAYSKTFNSQAISQKEMPIYFNLWCFQNKAPENGKEVEIIIRKFKFTPIPKPSQK